MKTYIIQIKINGKYTHYGKYKSLEDAIHECEILKENDAKVKLFEFTYYNKYIEITI